MSKLVVFKIDGDLQIGLKVFLEIGEENQPPQISCSGDLPPAPDIAVCLHEWQENYQVSSRLKIKKIIYKKFINQSHQESNQLASDLRQRFNNWFGASEFRHLDRKIRVVLNPDETIRVLISTDNKDLQKLPWHLWEFFDDYPNAEVALAATKFEKHKKTAVVKSEKQVRILAILGNSEGIDIEADRQMLAKLPSAKTVFLVEPSYQELFDRLWKDSWDLLFFAGHSTTHKDTGTLYINQSDILTIKDFDKAFLRAISKGLQLAIFNSCDGLGLAQNLVEFNIPQLIVMKQPVPDTVAKEFLKYFLEEYASGKSLYLSVRTARERLQGLEDEFPCASWLPIIYQNPLYVPLNWLELSGLADNKKSVKRNQEFIPIQLIDNLKYALKTQKTSKILSVMLVILSVTTTSKVIIISENIYQELNNIHLFLTKIFEGKNQEIPQASVLNFREKKTTMKFLKFKQSSNNNFEQVILSKLKPDKDKSDELDESIVSVGIDKANGTVKLFDICTGSELKTLQGRSGSVLSVSFNPDGKKVASASNDEIIRLWSVEGKERKTLVVSRGIDRSIAQGKPEPISRSQGEVIETRTSSPIQQSDVDLANCHDNLSPIEVLFISSYENFSGLQKNPQ